MIFSGNTQVYIYTGCIDMRNSIDGLSAKVQELMGKDPFTGDLFVFSNRYHNMIKVLYWHTNGFCLWMKRLEKGRFKWPKPTPTADMFCVKPSLRWILRSRRRMREQHQHQSTINSVLCINYIASSRAAAFINCFFCNLMLPFHKMRI